MLEFPRGVTLADSGGWGGWLLILGCEFEPHVGGRVFFKKKSWRSQVCLCSSYHFCHHFRHHPVYLSCCPNMSCAQAVFWISHPQYSLFMLFCIHLYQELDTILEIVVCSSVSPHKNRTLARRYRLVRTQCLSHTR